MIRTRKKLVICLFYFYGTPSKKNINCYFRVAAQSHTNVCRLHAPARRFVQLIQNNFARLQGIYLEEAFCCRLIQALISRLSPLEQASFTRATPDTEGRMSKREQATLIAIAEGGSGCRTRIRRQQKLVGLLISFYDIGSSCIFKHFKELRILSASVAWRANTSNRFVVPVRQAGNRYLDSLKGLQIRAQFLPFSIRAAKVNLII